MKKYLSIFLLIISISVLLIIENSHAIESNIKTEKININIFDLEEYINDNHDRVYLKFCSFDDCYNIRNEKIKTAINNFMILQKKRKSEEYLIEAEVKGIPITEVTFILNE